jgi:superfamily II DNA helicase RecQ
LVPIDLLAEISLLPETTQQPVSLTTMAPLSTANTAPNGLAIAPSLGPIAIDLTNDFCPPPTAREQPTDRQRAVIIEVMKTVWGISSPREFQVEAVARLVFEPKTCLYLIRKTGEGKSAVVLSAATLLRGITLVVVPLLGLGCDQVAKAHRRRYKVEAYHLDENRGNDQVAIQTRLLSITQVHAQSIILFTSPQSLKEGSSWAPLLKRLSKRQLFTLLVFDEAHTIPLHGRSFRREFIEMRKGVLKYVFRCHPNLRVLAMSASFRLEDQTKFSSIMSVKPTQVLWGPMSRRGILLCVSVLGDLATPISNEIALYLKHDETYKVIVYTNTKSSAEGHLLTLAKKTMATHSVTGDAIPLTGDSGLMMKNWLVSLFSGAVQSPFSNLQVLLATAAANCGISSIHSLLAVRYGFPPTLIDLLQEMGRVCRGVRGPGNLPDRYHLYLNCNLFLSLLLRIKQEPSVNERSIQLKELFKVLRFLLLPIQCYHVTLEEYFEDPSIFFNREPCETKCSFCLGAIADATTTFRRAFLVSFLSTKVFLLGPVSIAKLIKSLGDNKSKLFTTPGYKLNQGVVHALVLQLFAAGILSIYVADETREGTNQLSFNDFVVNWAIIESEGASFLAHTDCSLWSAFNCI